MNIIDRCDIGRRSPEGSWHHTGSGVNQGPQVQGGYVQSSEKGGHPAHECRGEGLLSLRDEIPNIINKSVEERNLVRRNLKDLGSKTKGDDKWMAKLLVIGDMILQHVGQEGRVGLRCGQKGPGRGSAYGYG